VTLVDTGEAVARQLARLLDGAGLLRAGSGDAAEARLQAYTSAGADALALAFSGLLGLRPRVDEVSIDHII
jgi:glutamate racemase